MTKQNCINLVPLVPDYPTNFDHFYGYAARAYNGTQDKSFSYTVSSTSEFGRYASISSPAQNDIYEISFLLKAGSYSVTLLYDKGTTRGIATVYFDDAIIGTIDAYASSTAAVNRSSFSVSVASSGVHTIKLKMLTKNASSTGYVFNCSGIFINPVVVTSTVRVNCGGNRYVDSLGQEWLPDSYFSGGTAWDIEFYTGAYTVTGTNDQTLYKFERSADPGTFSYTIPINSGTYTINLLFSENNKTAAGQRVGTVALNGTNILTNFDIYAQTGGQHKALVKTFTNQSLSALTLTITNTLINGIELIRTA